MSSHLQLLEHQRNPIDSLPLSGHLRYVPHFPIKNRFFCCACHRIYLIENFILCPGFEYIASSCCGGYPICNSCSRKKLKCDLCKCDIQRERRKCYDEKTDSYPLHYAATIYTFSISGDTPGNFMGCHIKSFRQYVCIYKAMPHVDRCVFMSLSLSQKVSLRQMTIRPVPFHFFHHASNRDHPWLSNNVPFYQLDFLQQMRMVILMFNLSNKLFQRFFWYAESLLILSNERERMLQVVLRSFREKSLKIFLKTLRESLPGLPTHPNGAYDMLGR